ncbi:MAG TPA: putative glycoside hydrolase, partial [Spirochaetia bacterium]|nr:putative glycoside hydrolase [Spirochaetia bacterium]
TEDPIDTLTSLGVDPSNGMRVAVTTETGIYLSSDGGMSWRSIPVHKPIKNADFLTSVALSPFDQSTIAVGTSFAGIFVTTDEGKSWVSRAGDLDFIYRGDGFYEEVAGLAYSPDTLGVIYLGVGFGGEVYRSSPDWKGWASLGFPGASKEVIRTINLRAVSKQSAPSTVNLDVETQSTDWQLDISGAGWKELGPSPQPPAPSAASKERMKEASDRAGIYISPWDATGTKLDHWISFLKDNGLNTLVVDVKDDHGHITYDTKVPLAHTLGAVHPYFNLDELVKKAHANGIYVVGRLVVFKDEFLYQYDNHRYAIWDPKRDSPWGHFVEETDKKTGKVSEVQKEFWVDPFSDFTWRYNLSIADELQKDGVDEIQFDYIRFPSEQSSRDALYRFRRKGMSEENALESFLKMARGQLSIPFAVDLFGYNSWYPITGWVGQDIEVYSNYADVIDPMFYPSLFPRSFLGKMSYLDRAKYLYRMGTWRAQRIVNGRAIIRPFVQAFLLGSYELAMDKPQYSTYLRTQLEGLQEAHAPGFLLWNFGTNYYMVTFPLTPYVPTASAPK